MVIEGKGKNRPERKKDREPVEVLAVRAVLMAPAIENQEYWNYKDDVLESFRFNMGLMNS